jgi:hypothetical protein
LSNLILLYLLVQAALRLAIEPMVAECVSSVLASKQSNRISFLRSQAEALAITDKEEAWIRQRLHQPTIALRTNPGSVDENSVLKELERELLSLRLK